MLEAKWNICRPILEYHVYIRFFFYFQLDLREYIYTAAEPYGMQTSFFLLYIESLLS